MSVKEIGRRLVGGVWQTDVRSENGGGGADFPAAWSVAELGSTLGTTGGTLVQIDGVGNQVIVKNNANQALFEVVGGASVPYLDLDPQNGQIAALSSGYLRLAAANEPNDSELAFNGCFIFYIDGNDLKAKAKIGGSFLHLTIGTFT